MGKMATKSLMTHEYGINFPVARIIIPAIAAKENAKENLNFFKTFGTSMKKLDCSTSFAVAPQVCGAQLAEQ